MASKEGLLPGSLGCYNALLSKAKIHFSNYDSLDLASQAFLIMLESNEELSATKALAIAANQLNWQASKTPLPPKGLLEDHCEDNYQKTAYSPIFEVIRQAFIDHQNQTK